VLKFASDAGFQLEVRRRVGEYFRRTGLSTRDSPRMYLKTAAILLWAGASYGLLVFGAVTWWQAVLLSCSLAAAMGGIGFSIQHDANHGAYSRSATVNRLLGMTLDLMGGSSYVWQWKHNVFHHTYPNLDGQDEDINVGPFARLCPSQRRRRLHRVQQFYLWALYGFLVAKWQFIDDFRNVTQARIATNRFPRPSGWNLFELIGGKLFFVAWAFGVPLIFHRWWVVLVFYSITAFLFSVILAVVFQAAHCVEEADFPEIGIGTEVVSRGWAVHQLHTTVDFARRNRVLSWYLGGLNFQVEHHLFPKICHVHYARISEIVQTVCAEYDLPYRAHPGFMGAVSSHWRWLRRMGRPAAQSPNV
jgi:linoleoyl-CoA desaturase